MIDAFKNIFGIASPSRVMAAMGGHLMTGLANGITGSQGLIGASWSDVGDLMSMKDPAFSPASMGFGSGSGLAAQGGGSGTVINIARIDVAIPAGTSASDTDAITASVRTAVRTAMDEVARDNRVGVIQRRGL
jgi:hypothetical protein